jgi:4-diphosphocytidyl-2-C-methyl-D-erythritol kinase
MPTTVRSYCKINLGLAIGPSRADGYHALTTLYQTLSAHDLVTVSAAPVSGPLKRPKVSIASNDPRVPSTASGSAERNTAWKIIDLVLKRRKIAAEVTVHIEKRLPVQGGLGAGSANAAAALVALERELAGHPGFAPAGLTGPEKLLMASEVGSDVPLFLIGGSVLGVGRGEEVYPLPDLPATHCVLALPDVGVSTPQAFRDWDALHTLPAGPAPGLAPLKELTRLQAEDKLSELSRALASAMCEPHSSGVLTAKANRGHEDLAGNPILALVRTGIENDFEEVVFRLHPSLGQIKRILAGSRHPEQSALYAGLSGSGSALFGLYPDEGAAAAAEARLNEQGVRSLRTKTLPREAYWSSMLVKSAG